MKILYLNQKHFIFGGLEKVVISEASYLNQAGHSVAVACVDDPNTLNDPIKKYFFAMDEIDQAINLGKKPAIGTYLKYMASGIHNVKAAQKFREILEDFKPDIVHSHLYSRYFTPSVFKVIKQYNIPIVTTEHDHKLTCPAYYFMKGWEKPCKEELCINGNFFHCVRHKCMEKSLTKSTYYALELYLNKPRYLKHIDHIIVPSNYLKGVLQRSGIPKDKLTFLKNFVQLDPYMDPNYIPGNYYVFFGRISAEKGVMTLVKSFEKLKNLSLKLIGTGNQLHEINNYVKSHAIDNIELLGYRPSLELFEIVKHSRAVIHPSEHPENAALSILESMACGKPLIASNIGGIPEFIRNQPHGRLFTPGNQDELTQAILSMQNLSNEEIISIGKNNRALIENEYTLDLHCKHLIDIYEEVIANHSILSTHQ